MKTFNISGACIPEKHYMADMTKRLEKMKDLIEKGEYFTINRARQYGKTTILRALDRLLQKDYIVIHLDFQKQMSNAKFKNENVFSAAFAKAFVKNMQRYGETLTERTKKAVSRLKTELSDDKDDLDLVELFEDISDICSASEKKLVLMIDEADSAKNNQVFLDFLAQLRAYYMERDITPTFQSVILAGVYDIKNLKRKIREEDDHMVNSPWNIAVPFSGDMSLSIGDIEGMLLEYQKERKAEMNIRTAAEILSFYTGGYPFLVSCLCKKLDEENRGWGISDVRLAVRDLLKEKNTLFDDVIKNIRNHKEFSDLTEQILLSGAQVAYEITNPTIELGAMFGIYRERDGKTTVSNVIFETLILNYFSSVRSTYALTSSDYVDKSQYIQDGRLNMEHVLKQFSLFLYSEYREEDDAFLEQQGRLLFLSFLRPIINGTGHYAVEPQTRKNDRMDIQVFYGKEEFIVELKIWRGKKYEQEGYDQLVKYLRARNVKKGYLLSFCGNEKKPWADRTFLHQGHEICEVIAAYRGMKEMKG